MDYVNYFINKVLQRNGMASHRDLEPVQPPNPLSYPKSSEPFSNALFNKPTPEYRGCPFWAWNNKLDKDQLLRQIDNFAEMGMGGFHMHVRTGLDTEYMGSEFMDILRSCVEYAESKKMMACLYDDDRWPSGSAGGRVVKENPEHKGKHILFTPHLYGTIDLGGTPTPSTARACRSENGYLLATFDVELGENGCLKSSRRLKNGESGANLWYAYVETNPGSPWFNDQTYVDSLSPEAMARFIEVTHEAYKNKVGDKFGTTVPCIFTDEPQFATKTQLSNSRASDDVFLPWTIDLPKTFEEQYGECLVDGLAQIIWNLPDGQPSSIRYQYHDHVCERFVSAFVDQLASWCEKNNLMLDGHMMEEPSLWSQTTALGEAMRCYRNMQMPGMDLLADRVEYNTAKQASSVSRQNGTRGTMSEIYGVTHWYFTFEGHKGCGDWQAALGVTFRVHHLTWVSMAGEGKRDYPACIGYQSPWYKEYGYVEDHFARVSVAMTRGKAVTRVGVIHPIESFWLCFGPNGSGDEMGVRDRAFGDLSNWLLHGLIDFDFISESLLTGQISGKITDKLQVGHCSYDVIVLPNLRTIRSSTLKILRKFTNAGGKVVIVGSGPEFVDAKVPMSNPMIEDTRNIYWSQQSVLSSLEQYRDIRILTEQNEPTDNLLYQMRQDDDERFVFICNTDRTSPVDTVIQLKGAWQIQKLDTLTGGESRIRGYHNDGWTIFRYRFEGCASLLLRLSYSFSPVELSLPAPGTWSSNIKPSSDIVLKSISLSEPNVLMLDYAKFNIDNEELWSGATEVLQIDNIIRERLHIPRKGFAWKQPYAVPDSERRARANVTLRFRFESLFDIAEPTMLALENANKVKIYVNNKLVSSSTGKQHRTWWVDEAINTVPIPRNIIALGENTVELKFPFGILTNIERIYLLGNFAVYANFRYPAVRPLDLKELTWGDITTQGLPFYVGNMTYNCSFSIPIAAGSSKLGATLSVPDFSSPVLTIHDSKKGNIGRIALQPRTLDLGKLKEGHQNISITAYGNRYNSFGHIHLQDGRTGDCWPDIWRTNGDWWTDDYKVKPLGVLQCPSISVRSPGESDKEQSELEGWVMVRRENQ